MSVSITKEGLVKASGEINPNLLSRYVAPGQGSPTSTSTAGRTQYYGDYGIIIPATENADTYFRLFLKQQLTANAKYTISCNVSGLLDGSYYRFPLFAQGNTSMGVLQLDHNGLCTLTFTMTYGTQTAISAGSETIYICFMDDSVRALASGQGAITVTHFKLEAGEIATPWCPYTNDPNYTGDICGFTEIDATQCSIGENCITATDFIEW